MAKPLGEVQKTGRGFELIEFRDFNQDPCSLQASSLAIYDRPGISAVWLGSKGERMHLDRDQVESLIAHLHMWLDSGSFDLTEETEESRGSVEQEETSYGRMKEMLSRDGVPCTIEAHERYTCNDGAYEGPVRVIRVEHDHASESRGSGKAYIRFAFRQDTGAMLEIGASYDW